MPKPAEVSRRSRSRRLDLDPDDGSTASLEQDIDLPSVSVPVVELARDVVLPRHLSCDLRRDERLEQHPGDRTILGDPRFVDAEEMAQQPGIGDIGLGSLDDPV